jgi:hypothetical protein
MPTVSASFTRPADTVPYHRGDLICNAGTPVALEFTPPATTLPLGAGSDRTVPGFLKFRSARLIRATGAAPAAIRLVALTRRHVRADAAPYAALPVEWPAYTGTDNAAFPTVPFVATLDFPRIIPAPRVILPDIFDSAVQNQLPSTPIRVLLQAMEPFTPLSGETFTLELSTDYSA